MLLPPDPSNLALIRDPEHDRWLLFRDPIEVLVAMRIEEVIPVMNRLEQALSKPGTHAAGFLAYEAAPAFDQALKTQAPSALPLAWFGLYREPQALADLPAPQTTSLQASTPNWTATTSRESYDGAIAMIQAAIARGDTYQVNHTFRLVSAFNGDPYATFCALAQAQKAPYAAYLSTDQFAICSASPELFFSLEGDRICSRPMKGTAARGRTTDEDCEQRAWLQGSLKNQAENVMIVDMVRNDIGRIAETGSVKVPELFALEKYPTVWQMVSTVTGRTRASYGEIFAALFPAASITGAPKPCTMEIIQALETSPRGIYTGCIGFINPGRWAQFNVAIRTVAIDKASGAAEYGTGGGITWDSVDSAEYEECRDKAKILTLEYPSFQLLESLLWTPEEGYFLLDLHLNRLADSADYFSFPVDLSTIKVELDTLECSFSGEAMKVRVLVDERGRVTLQAERLPAAGEKKILRVRLAEQPVDSGNYFLYHKTTHRKFYEQAMRFRTNGSESGWDDAILWNERGEVTESTTANLVVEEDGEWYTPPVDCGLLPGTYRAWLISQGRLKERVIRVEDLREGVRIYLINSVRKLREARVRVEGLQVEG
jgi:para-aminobenzoate synthetase/4-amino-4-deoxychorismate lyase